MKITFNEFTIYQVEEVKKLFIEELKNEEFVVIDFDDVTSIDMPAIQLLLSLNKACDRDGKVLQINNVKDTVYRSLVMCGVDAELGVCDGE